MQTSGETQSTGTGTDKPKITTPKYTLPTHRIESSEESTAKSSPTYDPHPRRDGATSTVIDCNLEGRWLLVCASARTGPMSLSQMDVRSTDSDQDLFRQLKQSYSTARGRWSRAFSLRKVKSIKFVQVSHGR